MLAPIVTKEMKLFPSQPLPNRIKNVRSRAQSLQDFANGNAIHVSTSSSVTFNTSIPQNGAQTQFLNSNDDRSIPIQSRNSRSIGSLPANTGLATGYHNNTSIVNSQIVRVPSAKTSPKYSTSSASLRKPLDSIVEGVEQGSSVDNTVKNQTAKVKQMQSSSSKEERRKGVHLSSKTQTCPHCSSDDGLILKNTKTADKEKRAQRTHSMEGGRKKRNETRGSNGCFSMWLSSKFRKNGNGNSESSESNSSSATTSMGK